jgi:hypothetical protein
MVLHAVRDGTRRVRRAPAMLLGVLALTLLLALPLGLVVRGMIAGSFGASLAADTAESGVNSEWWDLFSSQASGLGKTFTPRIIGVAAVASNLGAVLDAEPQALVITAAAGAYLLLWTFLYGGILDRFARNRPTRTPAFFSACGVFFFRFLRLALVAAFGYLFLFGVVHDWLFGVLYPWATHNWTVERTAFLLRLALYAVFGGALLAFNLWLDYAKVRAVVEDRRSMIGALVAAFRFVRRHPAQAIGVYLVDGLMFVVVVGLYMAVVPGAGTSGWSMWVGVALSEAYLLARLWVKLVFCASEVSLFQSLLAHAGYVATPAPVWPESPTVEAIEGSGLKAQGSGLRPGRQLVGRPLQGRRMMAGLKTTPYVRKLYTR